MSEPPFIFSLCREYEIYSFFCWASQKKDKACIALTELKFFLRVLSVPKILS